ncbi:hypothetical protein ACLESO_31655 [Pyxidicoccus sp. 3LG]
MRPVLVAALLGASLAGCMRKDPAPQPPQAEAGTSASPSPVNPDAPGAVLFVSADTRGYLGPCGCSENMRGGIARAAAQVLDARKGPLPVLYVDGGNSLFGEPHLKPGQVPQEERKAKALADAMRLMGLSVRATGPLDDTQGEPFRQGLGLPELPPGAVKLLPAGARKVGVVAADTPEQLVEASARARSEGADFVVALLTPRLEGGAGRGGGARGWRRTWWWPPAPPPSSAASRTSWCARRCRWWPCRARAARSCAWTWATRPRRAPSRCRRARRTWTARRRRWTSGWRCWTRRSTSPAWTRS